MAELGDVLDLLSWPAKLVNHLRDVLAELNAPLSAAAGQLLALIVFALLIVRFWNSSRAREAALGRLLARVLVAAAGIGGLSIVGAWADQLLFARSEQIIGQLDNGAVPGLRVDLLDFRGESLAPKIENDSHGGFIIDYAPVFADPPAELVLRATDCAEKRIALRRSHLLGALISVSLDCEGRDG